MKNSQYPPQHVAIIMDGNRRWAKKNGLKMIQGHRKVANEMIERLTDHCQKIGIKYLTLWAFSTENWNRAPQEVSAVMDLFREALGSSSEKLHKKGVRIRVIGDLSKFPQDIQQEAASWVDQSSKNSKMTVTFALNYGGRDEIVRAANKALLEALGSKEKPAVTIESFEKFLDSAGTPDPDLIIRPGGEKRLSGFLPWQSVYSELYFTDALMPDFDEKQLDIALAEFKNRQRRFGK